MLSLLFLLSLYSGIELHVAGHGNDHAMWHKLALLHSTASILFMTTAIIHVKSHWGWYKSLKKLGGKGKRKVVLLLSVVFATVAITGLSLLFVYGANSSIGLFHYKIGIAFGILAILHILKRIKFLIKGFSPNMLCKKR